MAALTEEEIKLLGPIIEPFARSKKPPDQKKPKVGEKEIEEFKEFILDGIRDGKPPQYVFLDENEIEQLKNDPANFRSNNRNAYREKCFLWVIDSTSIKIVREKTRNRKRTHDPEYVCHTNLTGAGLAFIGGEMFFDKDFNVYVNYFSDRYGNPSTVQWETAKAYIKSVGYLNLVDILDLL